MKLAVLLGMLAACKSDSGSSASDFVGSSAPVKKGSGGFSASMTAEMSKDGSAVAATGSATGSAMAAGSADAKGSAVAMGSDAKGSAVAMGSDAKGSAAEKPDGKGSAAKPPDGKGSAVAMTGSAAPVKAGSAAPPVNAGSAVAPTKLPPVTGGPPRPSEHRAAVKPPPDLAAIKLDLEPNWDRDFDQAGTISFVLNVPATNDKRVFSFTYGYDVDKAPADREAYKKFLADQRLLSVTLDRQRGAAWYLEGTDANGNPAFRYLVLFGGKRLVCGGLLFKDKDSTALGADLRDKVVAAAKKICETLSL